MIRFFRGLLIAFLALIVFLCVLWAFGALYFDFPWIALRGPAAVVYALAVIAGLFFVRTAWTRLLLPFGAFVLVLVWWLTLQPSNDRNWREDVAKTAWAEIDGDKVTIHNFRNFDYRSATDMIPRWETRTVDLSKLKAGDISIGFWGVDWMAHPIASFAFEDSPPVAFSIETRPEVGEEFSALGGLYRGFELIYVVGDERDLIRVRTNFREGEDAYLYRTTLPPEDVRIRFMEYIHTLNELHERPRWYNALFANCTTAIRTQRDRSARAVWDWRILLNGFGDRMLFERGALVSDGLSFEELRKQAHINAAAQTANDSPDFSEKIREGRVGF